MEQVLADVPAAQRCTCEPARRAAAQREAAQPGPVRESAREPVAAGGPKDGKWARLVAWIKSPA
ncbi:hypothetical protein [Streptomyces sp. Da 82-17]|uniref:hypothetical protein n=1 Tax=Streptomyces sp. Da 82-17 TaxID=3377116 RepID=UPI0038D4C023